MEQPGRGNEPTKEGGFHKETKQIPRFLVRGQQSQESFRRVESNVLPRMDQSTRKERALPKPPPRVAPLIGRGQQQEGALKLEERYVGQLRGSQGSSGSSSLSEPEPSILRFGKTGIAPLRAPLAERKVAKESGLKSPRVEPKLNIIAENALHLEEPQYAQLKKLPQPSETLSSSSSDCYHAQNTHIPAIPSLRHQTLPVLTKTVLSEASKYSIEIQVPKQLQKFPVCPSDRVRPPPLDPPEKGIFPYTLSSEVNLGGALVGSKTSHVTTKVSDEQKVDSSKNSKVSKWMSSWLQFRHRRKAQAEHGPAIDRGGLDVTPLCSEGFRERGQIGPRARFNERKERSRTLLESRGQSLDSKSGSSKSEGPKSKPELEPPKHIFSWRSTSGPIPPRLEAHTPPLLPPKLLPTPNRTTNPWSGKKVEIGLLEPRALTALHSIPDQDRLSATLGKIFKASPHLRNALAHHFGVTQKDSNSGPLSANEAVVLAVGIDLYIEEVFQQLDPEAKGFVTTEDFLLLCEILSLPKTLPPATPRLNLEQFRNQLFEHFVASFEETDKNLNKDSVRTQVTVSRRAGILDKISQNIDKLLSTLELEEMDCDCPDQSFKHTSAYQAVCARCRTVDSESLKSPHSARIRIRELQTKVLSQQREIHALREVVEDMRMALQSSDAENLALKVRLKKQQKGEGKKGIDRLVEELREIGQTGTSAPHNSFDSETSSIDDELQAAMQALQSARADLQITQEELNQTAMRLMQKEREIESNRETFGELRGTLEAAQLEIRRLHMELQESQTTLLFTQAELDGTSAELRAAKREIRKREAQLRDMNEKLADSVNSRERLLEELQRTRDLLAQCLSRVKQLELLQAMASEEQREEAGLESVEALSDEADGNEPPKTDDSGLYSPVISDKDEQEGETRSRSRSREAISEDDLWHSPETDFDGSTNENNSTAKEIKQGGMVKSLQQQIGTLQKQFQDMQIDWEEERCHLLSRLNLSDEDRAGLAKSLRDAEYEAERLKAIEDKLRSVLRSMATLHTMSLSRRSMGRLLTDAIERSIDPLTNECNLFKFLATLQQSSAEMERVGTETLINLALSAVK